jgi:hypothetical protein
MSKSVDQFVEAAPPGAGVCMNTTAIRQMWSKGRDHNFPALSFFYYFNTYPRKKDIMIAAVSREQDIWAHYVVDRKKFAIIKPSTIRIGFIEEAELLTSHLFYSKDDMWLTPIMTTCYLCGERPGKFCKVKKTNKSAKCLHDARWNAMATIKKLPIKPKAISAIVKNLYDESIQNLYGHRSPKLFNELYGGKRGRGA